MKRKLLSHHLTHFMMYDFDCVQLAIEWSKSRWYTYVSLNFNKNKNGVREEVIDIERCSIFKLMKSQINMCIMQVLICLYMHFPLTWESHFRVCKSLDGSCSIRATGLKYYIILDKDPIIWDIKFPAASNITKFWEWLQKIGNFLY